MSSTLDTLLLPLFEGEVSLPDGGCGFFLQADPAIATAMPGLKDRLICEQPMRSAWAEFAQRGWRAEPVLPGGRYDFGFCLLTKHKAENLANLARALRLLAPGALLLFAGANDIGADSLARAFSRRAGSLRQRSKNHARVFWLTRDRNLAEGIADWEVGGAPQQVAAIGGWSQPGLYNWNKVDAGSALLAAHLPTEIGGRVADLGAGWGYLSRHLVQGGFSLGSLDLFEIDARALTVAETNLRGAAWPVSCHWHDIREGLPAGRFDWIVSNPPFHDGKAADPGLGQAFIRAAASALAPGGRFLLVANRQLPYEAVLGQCFKVVRTVIEKDGYKVLDAQRGRN